MGGLLVLERLDKADVGDAFGASAAKHKPHRLVRLRFQ